ncbi:11419_t:CDS:10 [Funneliformis geosporum]|uniref:11419_t:CDS:1 n=1 Tax=Funneliformis geosporum TaxID=1117311 RepID=A0A9W4SHP7_9GLOM|nr:11419_t:CDS:10 [Funneliformis geosporum]
MLLEYANMGNLRDYLGNKRKFSSLQWKDKIKMALDITSGLLCLHSENIIHRDLVKTHSKNILVHNNRLMIADFGLSKIISDEISTNSDFGGLPEYIDPQCYIQENYIRNKKSDIFSLGILLWEITSGRPPFSNIDNRFTLIYQLINSQIREEPVESTPLKYQQLYQKCWNENPALRPENDDGIYKMLLEYANMGNLRDYLGNKRKFSSLQWKDKIKMALDITSGLLCLHSENIIHRDLHSKNILVHNNRLMIADFRSSKKIIEVSTSSKVEGLPAYIDPQCFMQENYIINKKSDIFSLGILLWEITSGRPPFLNIDNRYTLIYQLITSQIREEPVESTPLKYQQLYQKCWNENPALRPESNEVNESLNQLLKSRFINEFKTALIIEDINKMIKVGEISQFDYSEFSNFEEIGNGRFGIVNRADFVSRGIQIALKSLLNRNTRINKDVIADLVKELNIHIHPNIFQFIGITVDNDGDYKLVLEYANGGNLRNYLGNKIIFNSLKWKDKIQMALDITCGLSYLHKNEIIHGNLKINEVATSSRFKGLPEYIDPQCYIQENYESNYKSDIYSLGVLLWEITNSDGYYIMVLEYANEGNLRDYLGNENIFKMLQWKDKVRMSLDIASGLMCLHKEEIIHRDLHSMNILVNNGKLLLADFGLSKHVAETTSNSKTAGFGMIEYIDPQCYKHQEFKRGKKSDIFSLGVILWEITSGHPPFSDTPRHLVYSICNEDFEILDANNCRVYRKPDFHSGNILQGNNNSYISDFGLTGPADKQKSDDRIYGVLPYIAPEVLNGEPYTFASDIYSFGVIMAEYSSGNPPFYDREHDYKLSLDICNGLRPEFGKGTPEFYKILAYRCMNANPNQRLTSDELYDILDFCYKL